MHDVYCTYRYGNCVPYNSSSLRQGTPCDDLYIQNVDYVFIPFDRANGTLENYLYFVEKTRIAFNLAPEICKHEAKVVFCHYFLPPCGNSAVFEPPTSVCKDVCSYTHSLCPEQWALVKEFMKNQPRYVENGFTMINCSNTGEYLDPLSHCCEDLGINEICK